MNCLLLRYVAKNVNCNIVAKSIYFFSLSNWIFFTHNVFMFDFFFYFKAWKIDWEFVGTCFLDSLSHRKFFPSSGSLQIAKALESDYGRYECVASNEYGVAYSYAAMLYVRGAYLQVAIEKRRKTKTTQVNYIFTPIKESSSWEHEFWIV